MNACWFVALLSFSVVWSVGTQIPCDRTRRVLTQPWGLISDGPPDHNYTQGSHCQWLIKANTTEQFITLRFQSLVTECAYDYVYVYDGDSFESPMLGSFSGKTEPQEVVATSGFMLILLYSDTNYVLDGFTAEYSITECPKNCSGRGVCVAHRCICEREYGGVDCEKPVCDGCTPDVGICDEGMCRCHPGRSGLTCSLSINDTVGNRWHRLYSGGISSRAAHTAVYIRSSDSLYVFGGYDLNYVLGDLLIFRFNTSQWEDDQGNVISGVTLPANHLESKVLKAVLAKVSGSGVEKWGLRKNFFQLSILALNDSNTFAKQPHNDNGKGHSIRIKRDEEEEEEYEGETMAHPSARYGHAAAQFQDGFAVYGGKLDKGVLSDELWYYNITTNRWSLRAVTSNLRPPALARHTLTLTPDGWLYLLGGSLPNGLFSSQLWRIKLVSEGGDGEQWELVKTHSGKELDLRLVGHTTVYYSLGASSEENGYLLVHGGISATVARFSKLSDKMYSFHLQTMTWAHINYPRGSSRDTFVPAERAFHSSIVIGNYLAIFGGYTHRHNKEEICYDNQLYLYHLGCHTWVSHEILGSAPESKYPKKQGIFSHAAAVRNGNTMLLVGGYHGNVNSDLLAFTFPPTLASLGDEIHESETMCARHHGLLECTSDPECGWCSADEVCYGRTLGVNCTTNLQTTRCPGICPALSHCHACLLQGGKSEPLGGKIISVAQKLALSQCTWCIHNAKCHHIHDNFGVCGVREDTPSQGAGWWGEKGVEVTSPQDCKALDKRPGLTFIKYKHPANFSQPDFVSIINSTVVEFSVGPLMFGGAVSRMEQNLGGFITARLRGFLRPPSTWKQSQEQLRTCITYSSATLSLGVDPSKMQTVTDMSAELQLCYKARWINGDYVFLHESRYAIDFQAQKAVNTNHAHSHIEIQHNKTEENAKVFTFEYLEPYEGLEDCGTLTNCLACLTDSKCGWCPLTKSCLNRQVNETEACRSGEHWHYLTLDPHTCENCSNFITCNSCINSGLCEWWADDARCYRKGRSSTGIKKVEECPLPCYTRSNCSQCLDGNGKCVWCQATQECFSFSVYTSQYQFGLCREWSDQSGSSSNSGQWRSSALTSPQACQPCSTHSNCSTCLKSLGCGWCYNVDNPIQGVCAPGDFSTPHVDNCSNEVNARHHTSLYPDEAAWSYAQCPDVDECGLGLHDCHAQAKCTNTHGSYNCQCKRGYYGDGKDSCIKTCYNKCIHGYCSNHPDYVCQCNLGWTGPDCSINCGCNNHSTCTQGVNICDSCQDWTTGEFCQFCKPGSYGNATSPEGCKRCNCNEHGNQELGVCDSQTGLCVCQDNTEGATCDKCKKGYYGDPRRGGTCYYQCMSRGMVSSMKTQGLGSRLAEMSVWESRQGPPPTRECLWIISPDSLNQSQSTNSIIQLEIDRDIEVGCTENSVYVYDGLPKFVSSSGNHQSHVLGVFCTQDSVYPVTVQAKSGVMTVHYKSGGDSRGGFNATVSVLSCPDHCLPDRVCIKGSCVCPEGKTGYDCKDILCPNNCSAEFNRGVCDKGYGRCLCSEGWGGSNCSVPLNASHQIIFTELFNSVHLADSLEHLRKMLPRFGHSLLADKRNSLWLFGGYSLSHGPLNDIRLFDTKNNTWMQVTIDSTNDANMPRGRYFHAAEISFSRREIFIHGGLTAAAAGGGEQTPSGGEQALRQNTTLNDFWKFSLKNQHWVGIESNVKPPGLAGHTLTLRRYADSETLVLIGGFNPDFGFMDSVWEYDPKENEWRKIVTLGYHPIGVYGHSTVYHEPTQSFYVFGGYVYGLNRTYISDKLFALHYPSRTWTALPTFPNYNPPRLNMPRARFLHSAVTTDEYMLVFGGRTEPEASSETLIAYSYACNHWFKLYSRGMDIVGEMPPDTYAHSMTLDIDESTGSKKVVAYIMGGFTGGTDSHVTRISLPDDLCSVWSTKEKCRLFLGCTYCSLSNNGIMNSSYCYKAMNARDTSKNMSNPCGKHGQTTGTTTLSNGQVCGAEWLQERACKQFTTCTDCLARFPMAWDEPTVCKWCPNCGKCISVNTDCKDEKCDNTSAITIDTYCPEMSCAASDCDKCSSLAGCSWTRLKSYEAMSPEPIYDWSCTEVNRTSKTKSETSCPKRCSQYTDCHSCLQSYGGEGNWDECRWSTRLSECISPSYQPLVCAGGVCGLVLNKGAHCPQPCATFDQCSECLRHAHCGWCSLQSSKTTGIGVCSEGSLDQPAVGPEMGTCEALYSAKVNNTISSEMKFSWHYVNCPYENECENGHHNCDRVSESCVDLPNGYQCTCGPGYKPSGEPHKGECIPVCSQGCVRGRCTSPDTCSCDFGYVGANCSIQCQCNGHSHCAGPDKLDECLECKNNTQGPTCGRCKPLFVGDPSDNGECIPCSMFCNEHSSICVNETLEVEPEFFVGKTIEELELFLVEGPTTKAKCIGCSNMTTGDRCEECITGHFRGSEDQKVSCQPCQCHGHGSTCNPVTGEGCDCHNNTESDPTCSGKSHSCWEVQCSKCKESYMGIPTRGHQCYKQMTFDLTFSLGAKLVDDSGVKPTPLNPGQASFFAVQPRFMNVDIRITIDVTQGSLDLYLSPKDDVFTVELNTTTYAHVIKLDDRYSYRSDDARQFLDHFGLDTWFRPLTEIKYIDRNTLNPLNFKRRSLTSPINVFVQSPEGLSAHITLKDNNSLLIARNITDRLVITLPYETHSLNQAKFYIVLVAINKPTYGTVFFRQDQLHIDLFVFFSVFFSCFFLFLAACVVAWKAKQATDMRRARRRHVVEMLHMAKRPFAGVSVLLEPSASSDFSLRPVAIEPTHDSLAAVTTVFVTLPGGGYAPSRLAIASALVLINRGQSHGRAFLRRRSSHS